METAPKILLVKGSVITTIYARLTNLTKRPLEYQEFVELLLRTNNYVCECVNLSKKEHLTRTA